METLDQKYLKLVSEKTKTILELGGTAEQNLKEFFPNHEYKTLDLDPKGGADYIADAHNIPVADSKFDAVLAFNLIEHTHSPHQVVSEIYRVLKPGGFVLASTPFIHPYHGGRCPDYYRFTKDGLRFLFKGFQDVQIQGDGGLFLALCHFQPRSMNKLQFLTNPILKILDNLFTKNRSSSHQYFIFARKSA